MSRYDKAAARYEYGPKEKENPAEPRITVVQIDSRNPPSIFLNILHVRSYLSVDETILGLTPLSYQPYLKYVRKQAILRSRP